MDKQLRILLVDDDEDEFFLLQDLITHPPSGVAQPNLHLEWVETYDAALQAFASDRYDAYLVDYQLGNRTGLDLLCEPVAKNSRAPSIMLTGQGSYAVDVAAMQQGASDYLVKDQLNLHLLERSIRYAIERKHTQKNLEQLVNERTQELADSNSLLAQANRELLAEVTRRKQVEVVVRESESKFRALADTTSAVILIIQDLKILYANPAVRSITSYDPEELLGMALADLTHPVYQEVLHWSVDANGWLEGIPLRFELKILKKGGEERWVDATIGKIEYQGRPAWVLTAFDITERDMAQQVLRLAKDRLEAEVAERTIQLRQRAEELDALRTATSSLLNTLDLGALLGQILDSAQKAIPAAEQSWLHLAVRDTGQLQLRSVFDTSDPRIQKFNFLRSKDNRVKAVCKKKPLLIRDTLVEPVILPYQDGRMDLNGIRSAIVVPLFIDDHFIGSLSLSASRPAVFTEGDLRLLTTFAATAIAAIQNATLHAEVQNLATTDPLTGQLNRRALFDLGQRELDRFHRFGHPLSAILSDIDHFKSINDTYGHAVGDQVLQAVVKRIGLIVRQVDILCRYGGDEIVVLLPETDSLLANKIAIRIHNSITRAPVLTEAGPVQVSISTGIASAVQEIRDLGALLNAADVALYRAKQMGRSRVELATQG